MPETTVFGTTVFGTTGVGTTGSALLELDGISKSFGRVVVADNLSLRVGEADMIGIVGPNGAGKTSLFSLIAGDLEPDAGQIRLGGTVITRQGAAARCRLGVGRTYQVPRPFGAMTVFENVLVAVQQGAGLRRRASYQRAAAALARAGLAAEANSPAEPASLTACTPRSIRLAARPRCCCCSPSRRW